VNTTGGYCECGCGGRASLASKTNSRRGDIKGQPVRFIPGHQMRGELNGRWKGVAAGYAAVHHWARRYVPKAGRCSRCGAEGPTDLANRDHRYRRVVEDWVELCQTCHRKHDKHPGRSGRQSQPEGLPT